ncbi:surface protein, lpxtg-motif cell wall anchor domain protein [Brochothrix campestris FSL F6-1037]|uniref:Surface protein, lpxtg-motif cell wall anchor domain protein n=1 Tax=Brochothrix campestris FSL F6-1037 TaxID=1265861 RepID=W7C9Q6_9LIST|nr:surface protein, lpxtg-motif cell wall anchor domain protein [Brochothrix campestris FSL F6-1037]
MSGEKLVNNKTKATAHVGDTLNYSIKLTHEAGSGPWVGQVVDKLPNHVSYVPNSTTIDGKAVADKGIWNEQTLTVKELRLTNETATAVIAFKVKVKEEALNTTVVNKAVATPKDPDDNPPVPDIPSVPTVVVPTAGKLKAEKKRLQCQQ